MGCGGSKEDVATANTVSLSSRFLQKKSQSTKTDTTTTTTSSTSTQETGVGATDTDSFQNAGTSETENVKETGEVTPPVVVVPEVKPVATRIEAVVGGEVAGRLLFKDSPDRYFSPRKDDAAVGRRVGSEGAEYYSPPPELAELVKIDVENIGLEVSKEASDMIVAKEIEEADNVDVKIEKSLVSEDEEGEVAAPNKEEEGKSKSQDSADVKEVTLVGDKESEAEANVEKKNVMDGEMGNDSNSLTH